MCEIQTNEHFKLFLLNTVFKKSLKSVLMQMQLNMYIILT